MQIFILIIQIFLILFGVILLVMGFRIMYSEHIIKKHVRKYIGKVVGNEVDKINEGETLHIVYDPVVEYVNDKNVTVRKKSNVGSGLKSAIGQTIDVYEYKDKIFFDQKQELMLVKTSLLLFGTILVIVGICIK